MVILPFVKHITKARLCKSSDIIWWKLKPSVWNAPHISRTSAAAGSFFPTSLQPSHISRPSPSPGLSEHSPVCLLTRGDHPSALAQVRAVEVHSRHFSSTSCAGFAKSGVAQLQTPTGHRIQPTRPNGELPVHDQWPVFLFSWHGARCLTPQLTRFQRLFAHLVHALRAETEVTQVVFLNNPLKSHVWDTPRYALLAVHSTL